MKVARSGLPRFKSSKTVSSKKTMRPPLICSSFNLFLFYLLGSGGGGSRVLLIAWRVGALVPETGLKCVQGSVITRR